MSRRIWAILAAFCGLFAGCSELATGEVEPPKGLSS